MHGVDVHDPYRWLEDGDAPAVKAWTSAQNLRTRAVLDALPGRAELHARLVELLGVRMTVGCEVAGDRVFSLERGGGLDQAALFVRSITDGPAAAARMLVDPQALLGDETGALDWFHPSPDGSLVAFGLSQGGDERSTLRVVEVASGRLLADTIPDTRAASVAWLPTGDAFAYSRYPDPARVAPELRGYNRTIWWHEIGGHVGHDELVFGNLPDPTAWPDVSISDDGRWLLIHVALGWERIDVHLIDRSDGSSTTLVAGVDANTSMRVVGDRLVGTTTLDAPRGRVVEADLDAPTHDRWRTLVPESEAVIEAVAATSNCLLVLSTRDATSELACCRLDGSELQPIEVPDAATVVGLEREP